MNLFGKSIEGITNKMMKRYEKAMEAAQVFENNNPKKKLERLKEKLTEEFKLWSLKKARYPDRFRDVEQDIEYVKHLITKEQLGAAERGNIDRLCKKYSLT